MTTPNFADPKFLTDHIKDTLAFYQPNVLDPEVGFPAFQDDGSIYDSQTRHLVSSTRFVFNYAMAARHFDGPST